MATTKSKAPTKKKLAPAPLLTPGEAVDWWFLFKFNAAEEPEPALPTGQKGLFDFDGWVQPGYELEPKRHSQQYLVASSKSAKLKRGKGYLGTSTSDPLGATFDQIYSGSYYYIIWNDQFYDDPKATGFGPWGHSKGMLAWDKDGNGVVMQVSTPSWPASGNKKYPRQTEGNTLGYVRDNDIEVSQHFFATKVTKADVLMILKAMRNAAVVTGVSTANQWKTRPKVKKAAYGDKPAVPWSPPLPKPLPNAPDLKQVFNIGGPKDIQAQAKLVLAAKPGNKSIAKECLSQTLSNGMKLISKSASYAVPPWQLVSASLGGVDLRVASWWEGEAINSTTRKNPTPGCWHDDLGTPGAVQIALTGKWKDIVLGLKGSASPNGNHAKIGHSTEDGVNLSIFGDMNQMGAWVKDGYQKGQTCDVHQNGRGGMFFVVDNKTLNKSVAALIEGTSAPTSLKKRVVKKKAAKKKTAKKAVKKKITGKIAVEKKVTGKATTKKVAKKKTVSKKAVKRLVTKKKTIVKKAVKKAAKKKAVATKAVKKVVATKKAAVKKTVKKAVKKIAKKRIVKKNTAKKKVSK